jgi:hypothetical protein
LLSKDQKKSWIAALRELRSLQQVCAEYDFEAIAPRDESWFQYAFCSDLMFTESRERFVPRIRQGISGQETMIPLFFTSTRRLVLETLPRGMKCNQDYFIHAVFRGLPNQKPRISRGKGFSAFSVHIDNSMCHDGHKVSVKLDQ